LGVRGSVQVVSVERGPSVGATSAYCRRTGRLPLQSPQEVPTSTSSKAQLEEVVDEEGSPSNTVVLAFGDLAMCKPLLNSAKAAGVKVELLKYEKHLGHRQMV